jgi:DNA-binding response OmpR family regulator
MPIVNRISDNDQLPAQVVAHLRQAVVLIAKAVPGVFENLDRELAFSSSNGPVTQHQQAESSGDGAARHPIADRATFCVYWADQTCHLGNTVAFRLLERLAHRPNLYIHCNVLLNELWDDHTEREVIRSTVKNLRRKLRAAGMEDLAEAIDGSNSHHYGLMLNRRT